MAKFTIGDRVVSTASGNKGEVSDGFFYKDPEGNPPRHDQVPVQWDDGTASYIHPSVLDYETV